jgi:hypothetical protein
MSNITHRKPWRQAVQFASKALHGIIVPVDEFPVFKSSNGLYREMNRLNQPSF